MKRSLTLVTLTLLKTGHSFVLPGQNNGVQQLGLQSDENCNAIEETSRRGFLGTAFGAGVAVTSGVLSFNAPAFAAAMSQDEIDKTNVLKGYLRLQYLLDNWDKETTVCGMGGDNLESRCDRTPLKVMDYMGYKSTKDPLYKAEKTLRRLYENAPATDPKKDAAFVEAVDVFAENADEASGMAFISSWGEANPGGGKDRVELFIERAKKNVITSRNSLKTVIDILELDTSSVSLGKNGKY